MQKILVLVLLFSGVCFAGDLDTWKKEYHQVLKEYQIKRTKQNQLRVYLKKREGFYLTGQPVPKHLENAITRLSATFQP